MRFSPAMVIAALLLPALAGCLGIKPAGPRVVMPADLGYDVAAAGIHIDNVSVEQVTILSWDGITHLAAIAYVPHTSDRTPLGEVHWPLVVFAHGWGDSKENYQGKRSSQQPAASGTDRLAQVAQAGFVAVAYDARGFGESEGAATVAGPAEMADLRHVIEFSKLRYATSDKVGVVGASYGGGQALNAWANDELVTTSVAMYGWSDLYGALLPGGVPKLEWAQFLYGYGLAGSRADYDPMIHEWYTQLYTRSDLPTVKRQMDARSILDAGHGVTKPLLLCQGMQESLFPQIDQAWQTSAFTRAYVFTGGHGASNDTCWARTLDWFRFFLAGYDTRVDAWPALETVDADGTGPYSYASFPDVAATAYHLRLGELLRSGGTAATFQVEQRLTSNPLGEPSAIWDPAGLPRNPIPAELQQDPAAVFFQTQPMAGPNVIVGSPRLTLRLEGEDQTPFQVAGTLYRLQSDGNAVLLGRGAVAALSEFEVKEGTVVLEFPWMRAALAPGDSLQLKLAGNDPGAWVPLFADYTVTFNGHSQLDVPMQAA